MFVASIVKIKTINQDVLDIEWTLTSCALRLVCTCQQIRMCASCMTNPKPVNDYFIPAPTEGGGWGISWWLPARLQLVIQTFNLYVIKGILL